MPRREKRSTAEPKRSREQEARWIRAQRRKGKLTQEESEQRLNALGASHMKRGKPLASKNLGPEMKDFLVDAAAGGKAVTPLDYMLATLVHPHSTKADRQWAAEKAAPFMHRKMPLAIEGGDPQKPLRIAAADELRVLSPEEFEAIRKVSRRIAPHVPTPAEVMSGIAQQLLIADAEGDDND